MSNGFEEKRQAPFTGTPVTNREGFSDTVPVRAKLRLGPGGRVVIPAAIREKLGLSEGDVLMASFEDGELKCISLAESVRRAQALVRQTVPPGRSLVDELLAERRQEVLKESQGG